MRVAVLSETAKICHCDVGDAMMDREAGKRCTSQRCWHKQTEIGSPPAEQRKDDSNINGAVASELAE